MFREARKKKVQSKLAKMGLYFIEMDSRMNYGHIGNIAELTNIKVNIFPSTFYVVDKMFPVSKALIKEIEFIQKHFKDLR